MNKLPVVLVSVTVAVFILAAFAPGEGTTAAKHAAVAATTPVTAPTVEPTTTTSEPTSVPSAVVERVEQPTPPAVQVVPVSPAPVVSTTSTTGCAAIVDGHCRLTDGNELSPASSETRLYCQALGCPASPPDPATGCASGLAPVAGRCPTP